MRKNQRNCRSVSKVEMILSQQRSGAAQDNEFSRLIFFAVSPCRRESHFGARVRVPTIPYPPSAIRFFHR
jgi:hypothetical protein